MWLTTEFRPLRLAYEREFMIAYEGLAFIHMMAVTFTAIALICFAARRSLLTGMRLRRMLNIRRILCHFAAWISVAVAGGICFLCVHYRLTVTVLGLVGLIGAGLFVLFMFKARFFHNCDRMITDLRIAIARNNMYRGSGLYCAFFLQVMVVFLFQLVPVAMVLLEARILDAVATALPLVTKDTLRQLMGTGMTGAGQMYLVDGLRSVLGGFACLMSYGLYLQYKKTL